MTINSDLKGAEDQAGVWLSTHHIVLYVLLAGASLTGVYLVESKLSSLAEAKAAAAEQALAVEKDHSAQLAAAFAANEAQRQKDNAAFIASITQIQSAAKTQVVIDRTLPVKDTGHRIEDLTGFKQGTVVFDPNDNLIVPLPLGREIVARLDQGVADAQTVVKQDGVIKNLAATVNDENAIIVEDKKVLAATVEADAKVLNAEKAKARKSKLRWFGLGFLAGIFAGHSAGI
jgi:hypothetical protein